jgi:hypothetical protein
MSQRILSCNEVANVLKNWVEGKISSRAVHDWANALYLKDDVEYEDWEDDESITNEVIGALDMLDMNLAVAEDALIYLDFLAAPKGSFAKAYAFYRKRLEAIDYESRRKELRDDPPYAPFLKSKKD